MIALKLYYPFVFVCSIIRLFLIISLSKSKRASIYCDMGHTNNINCDFFGFNLSHKKNTLFTPNNEFINATAGNV